MSVYTEPTSLPPPDRWRLRLDARTELHVVEGTLRVEQSVTERARSQYAVEPDPSWEHTDPAGHRHRYADDGSLPTLDRGSRHVPCDGSCGGVCQGEGYWVPEYRCAVCDAVVEPGVVPDELARGPGLPVTGERVVGFRVHDSRMVLAERQHGSFPDREGPRVLTVSAQPAPPITGASLVRDREDGREDVLPLPALTIGDVQTTRPNALEVEVEAVEYVNLLPDRRRL